MDKKIIDVLTDLDSINKLRNKLPYMFQIAELESSRDGKIGMEVGSLREKIITAFLIYKFGKENVNSEVPITKSEIDVLVYGHPISIKTITGKALKGVKIVWTVDAISAINFMKNYEPSCDLILIHINWGGLGAFYYIPKSVQTKIFKDIGREKYIKLPKAGTNPRGAEISIMALNQLVAHNKVLKIPINWIKEDIQHNPLIRWVELWEKD